MHQISQRLAARHTVRVASYWKTNRTDWLLGTTWNAPGGEAYFLDGVNVTPLNYSRSERLALSPWVVSYFINQGMAINEISNSLLPKLRAIGGKPDIIHHGRIGREPLGFASLALARELKIPFVLTPYHHPRWNGWMHRYYHRLYREADGVIALTATEIDTLVALGVKRERIYITGTGAMLSQTYSGASFRQKYGLEGPVVLFLGQKFAYKGFSHILDAAPLVWKEQPDTHFVFIGPRTDYSRRLFKAYHNPRILELGPVELTEKTSALDACDVLCLPSTQESFGVVFIEAWKLGKPVIGADIPAVACVISDGEDGFVGPPEGEFIAGKILQLLRDKELSARMGAAGKIKAEMQYEWSTLAQRTEDIYCDVLRKF